MYVVIELQGHQYIVRQGDEIVVDRVDSDAGSTIEAPVLLAFDENGENVQVGKPYVDGKKAVLTVNDHQRGDKIHVSKFKRKNRYARRIGFRAAQSVLSVSSVA